jgi:8-amino-7-oxononanoate synthase
MVESAMRERLKPIVVTDGFCPRCGEAAPVGAYAQLALRAGGRLVLDDTQALGILGERRHPAQPYGTGGGGSLRWHDTFGGHIVTCSSLAKGFGVPVAMIAGERGLIERFRQESETRLHCSPPSAAVIHAARAALETNRSRGDALRRWLLHLVIRLRTRLIDAGLTPSGRLPFPVQTFVSARRNAALLHDRLQDAGIQGLLTTTCRALAAGLTLLITARHRVAEIERTGRVIADAAGGTADRLYPTIEDSWAGYALCPARIR